MGHTCGEPDEIELTAMGVELNGSQVAGGAFYFVNATTSKSAGHAGSFENPMYATQRPADASRDPVLL